MVEKIAVLGGGISGLSAAYFALRKGYPVEIFEATNELGGLAASFEINGLRLEKYYHFICGGDRKLVELAKRLGISSRLKFRETKTSFYYDGRLFPFSSATDLLKFTPIDFISRVRFGLNVINSRFRRDWEKMDEISAKEWLIQKIGEKAYDIIWHPLLKVKFGNYYDQVSAAWVWHRIHRVASSRQGLFSKEKMGYFTGGTETLIDALEKNIERAGGVIHFNSKIVTLKKEGKKLSLIGDLGLFGNFDRVILAVPLPRAANLIQGLDARFSAELSSVDFIGVVCGVFRIKEAATDAFWLNINDSRIAANGFIEYTNLNSLGGFTSDKILYIPFYVPVTDKWFTMDEESLKVEFIKMIKIVNPQIKQETIVGFEAFRSPYAQAVCPVGFKGRKPPLKTPIENIFLLDATQLYPSDRVLSALIGQAEILIAENF